MTRKKEVSVKRRSCIGQESVKCRLSIGEVSVNCRSNIGQVSVKYRSSIGHVAVMYRSSIDGPRLYRSTYLFGRLSTDISVDYRPTIGRLSTDISVGYRSAIGRLSTDISTESTYISWFSRDVTSAFPNMGVRHDCAPPSVKFMIS